MLKFKFSIIFGQLLPILAFLTRFFFHFWSAVWQSFITTSELIIRQVSMLTHRLCKSLAILFIWPWQMGTVQFLPMFLASNDACWIEKKYHLLPKINHIFSKTYFGHLTIDFSFSYQNKKRARKCQNMSAAGWPKLTSIHKFCNPDWIWPHSFLFSKIRVKLNRSIVRTGQSLL